MPLPWPRPRCSPGRVACALGLAWAAASFAVAPPASAAEPVRFAWVRGEGAEGCAGQQAIADGVTARLGEGAISATAPRSIEAVVSRVDRGFRVVLFVRGADGSLAGSRELTSESDRCASIEAASVLAVALAIDPDASTRPPPAVSPPSPFPPLLPEPSPAAPPAPASAAPAPALPPAPPPAPRSLVFPTIPRAPSPLALATDTSGAGLTLRAGPGFGLLPSPAPALSLAAHVALAARVEVTAEALWMPEARTEDRRFAFGLTAFSLGVCRSLSRARAYDLGVCAAVWGGALHAVVLDLAPVAPGDFAWAAASITPHLRVRVAPHVHLDLGVQVIVPFVRRSFEVSGWQAPVFQQAPVTLVPFGGAGLHFL